MRTEAIDGRIIDCHVHLVGDGVLHPYAPTPAYPPRAASLGELVALHDRWRIDHGVLVQVSVHGTDNSLMLDGLRQSGGRYRGVAVVDDAPADAVLAELKQAGVVGLRLNLMHGGGPGIETLGRYGSICREMDWHLQLFIDGDDLRDLGSRLIGPGVQLVLDHFGGVATAGPPSKQNFQTLLGLVRDGAWVKLSAPYRISSQPDGRDTIPFGQQLLQAAPGRCVWGSDWPHVATGTRTIDIGTLLDLARTMAGEDDRADALLFRNARKLYRFGAGA